MTGGGMGASRRGFHAGIVWTAAAAVLLAVVFAARLWMLSRPPHDADEFMFALTGRDVLRGAFPPLGVFDNKPVGLVYVFALAEGLGGQSVATIHALGAVSAAVAAWLLYRTARVLDAPRDLALALAALFSVEIVCLGGWLTLSEQVAAPVIAGANLLVMTNRRWWGMVIVGALYGLACQITYLAVPGLALSALVLIAEPGLDWRSCGLRTAQIGAGFVGAVALLWGPQLASGEWWPYVQEQVAYHHRYRLPRPGWSRALLSVGAPVVLFGLPFLLGIGGRSASPRRSSATLFAAQLFGGLAVAFVSSRFYSHYLIVSLPAATALLAGLIARLPPARWRGAAMVLVACAAAYLVPAMSVLRGWSHAADLEQAAARLIDSAIGEGQPILIFDESPMIYYLSRSSVAGRFAFVSHYMPSCGEAIMASPQTVLGDALASHPRMVLIGSQCTTAFDPAVVVRQSGYRWLSRIVKEGRSLDAYVPVVSGLAPPTQPQPPS